MSRLPTPGADKDAWGTILNDYLQVGHDPSGRPLPIAYGTTLPASPYHGQEAILVDNVTNPSYQWRFRYNANSSSAYKWEYVGGADILAQITATDTITAMGWVDAPTVGPRCPVPRAGDYLAIAGCDAGHSTAQGFIQIGIAKNGGTPGVPGRSLTPAAPTYPIMMQTSDRLVGMAAGDEIRLRYNNASGVGNFSVSYRWLRVQPIRVA